VAEVNDRPTLPEDAPTSPETPTSIRSSLPPLPVARRATPGKWCDTSSPLTRAAAEELRRLGYLGVYRYLPLPGNDASRDLTRAELAMLLEVGLEVGAVQHVRGFPPAHPFWSPAEHDALEDAATAIQAARRAGLPDGVHLFQDLEAVDGSQSDTSGYTVRWGHTVRMSGYAAGLYVGYSVPLAPLDLYGLPDVDCYWSDPGRRVVAKRGCAILQGRSLASSGVLPPIDEDLVQIDALGGLPVVASAA
jgi:Domain of unknown function (DUF1906)